MAIPCPIAPLEKTGSFTSASATVLPTIGVTITSSASVASTFSEAAATYFASVFSESSATATFHSAANTAAAFVLP